MRIVLVGAVESSQVALRTLVDCGRAPVGVLTLPRDLAGRHSDFADLARPASKAGAEIVLAADINSAESLEALRRLSPDLVLVVGWSQICGREFRSIAALGAVGFHPSALPKMRGRAVIPWTILRDEKETASTLFWLDAGTDSGDIIAQSFFPVAPAETARSLYARHLANLSAMLPQALTHIASGTAPRLPQDHSKATYCARRRPEDGFIDWMGTTAGTLNSFAPSAILTPEPTASSKARGWLSARQSRYCSASSECRARYKPTRTAASWSPAATAAISWCGPGRVRPCHASTPGSSCADDSRSRLRTACRLFSVRWRSRRRQPHFGLGTDHQSRCQSLRTARGPAREGWSARRTARQFERRLRSCAGPEFHWLCGGGAGWGARLRPGHREGASLPCGLSAPTEGRDRSH